MPLRRTDPTPETIAAARAQLDERDVHYRFGYAVCAMSRALDYAADMVTDPLAADTIAWARAVAEAVEPAPVDGSSR
jgi:hypothetical protein